MRIFSFPAVIPINSIPINENIAIWNDIKNPEAPFGKKPPSFQILVTNRWTVIRLHSKDYHYNTNNN